MSLIFLAAALGLMSTETPESVRALLGGAMRIESFGPPADISAMNTAAGRLGASFPPWLFNLYLACDGFLGPTAWPYLFPLGGRDGVIEFTEFLRTEAWSCQWLKRAIVFGSNTGSGTCTVHFCSLDGRLIEWCIGDGDEFTYFDGSVYDLYRREQSHWDKIESA